MNKLKKENLMENLTRYINKRLMKHPGVNEWGFSVALDGRYSLNVKIYFINNYTSRFTILITPDYDLDNLKRYFDFIFDKQIKELMKIIEKDDRIF